MKAMKLCSIMLGLLLATAVQASVEINEETFPDEAFRPLVTVYFNGGVINLNGGTVELNGETTVTTGTTLNINSN